MRQRRDENKQEVSSAASEGFTLLELLVAVTLLGLVFTMMAGGLRFGATVWERGGQVGDDITELQTAQTILRRQIKHMVPAQQVSRRHNDLIAVFGDDSTLRFVGRQPGHLAAPGPYLVQISESPSEEGKSLILSWRRLQSDLSDVVDRSELESSILMQGIEAAEFTYFGKVGDRAPQQWHPKWRNQKTAPKLIRVVVKFPQGDRRLWPALFVAPLIDAVR